MSVKPSAKVPTATRFSAQRGYILIVLMLFVALLAIGAMALLQKIDFQIKRDREEEMIHRGVQYSRAVRHYFKKFGRYPTRIEELEDTNHIRFLRKRYKDPITGKDFKPLHITDVQMSFSLGAVGGVPPGQAGAAGGSQNGLPATVSPFPPGAPGPGRGPAAIGPDAPVGDPGLVDAGQGDASQDGNVQGGASANGPGQQVTAQTPAQQAGAMTTSAPGPQVFGGGAIVGVVSTSKLKTIREFNKKDHYNQWQFIYDPSSDRGGLLMTPNQPPLKGATPLPPSNVNSGPAANPPQSPQPQQRPTPDQP